MSRTTLVMLVSCATWACAPESPAPAPEAATPAPESPADRFAAPVERAHGREAWLSRPALAAALEIDFGGNTILEGDITFTTDMSRSRIDTAAGPRVTWDGTTAWVSPGVAQLPMARFHVLTWPYFLLAPIKLRDPGSRLEPLGKRELRSGTYDAARLSFEAGVGDSPDDWYVVYANPETHRLHAMAYIVTFGTTVEKAEEAPHAIVYDELAEVEGALVPTRMRFYLWSEEDGIYGDPIGELRLAAPRFVAAGPETFEIPEGSREVPLPAAEG